MKKPMSTYASNERKNATPSGLVPRFLVVLFGTLEYDGRAQRMIEVLASMGEVLLVDIVPAVRGSGDEYQRGQIQRHRVDLPHNLGKLGRHLRFWLEVIRVARRYKPTVVVAEDFFTTFPAWLVAWMGKSHLIYDAYELIIPEKGRKMSPRDAFWYYLERWVVPRADLVIAANPERARLMAEHYGLRRTPEYMRNIPPQRPLDPSIHAEIIRRYPALARKNAEDRIILYQGDVSLERGLARFVQALAYLRPNYRLIVAGDGPDLGRLKELGEAWKKEGRFATLGRVPHALLQAVSIRADVGIVTYPYEGLNNIYCAPNKLFEYAQAGLPVIATDQPPLKALVSEYRIGGVISRDDAPADIAGALQHLVERREYYRANLSRFLEAHRWEDEAARLRRAIEHMLRVRSKDE